MHNLIIRLIILLCIINHSLPLTLKLNPIQMTNDITMTHILPLFKQIPFNLPTANICIGTPKPQCFNFALCTIFNESMIGSSQSKIKAFARQYNLQLSSSYEFSLAISSMGFQVFNNPSYYVYGKGFVDFLQFEGSKITNQKFSMFLFESKNESPLINIDGIIGLKSFYFNVRPTHSFLSYLFETHHINHKIFGLKYHSDGSGYAYFGEDYQQYDFCNAIKPQGGMTNWYCYLNDVSIGNSRMKIDHDFIEFHSMQNAVIATEKGGRFIIDYVMSFTDGYCTTMDDSGYLLLLCSVVTPIERIPDIVIRLDMIELKIQWRNMFAKTIVYDKEELVCNFLVNLNEDKKKKHWVVGIPGFIDNIIVFDKDEEKIRVIAQERSEKNKNNKSNVLKQTNWFFIKIAIGIIMIIMIIGIFLLFIAKNYIIL